MLFIVEKCSIMHMCKGNNQSKLQCYVMFMLMHRISYFSACNRRASSLLLACVCVYVCMCACMRVCVSWVCIGWFVFKHLLLARCSKASAVGRPKASLSHISSPRTADT